MKLRFRFIIFSVVTIVFSSCKVVHSTYLVEDVRKGNSSAFDTHSMNAIGFDGNFFFEATNTYGAALLKYDGEKVEPVSLVADPLYPQYFVTFRGELFFSNSPGGSMGGFWKYGDPPELLAETNVVYSFPNTYMEASDKLVFIGRDKKKGQEPHIFDGNAVSVVDIWPGNRGSNPSWFYLLNDQAFFNARDSLLGTELWVYSTSNDELKLIDLLPGSGSSYPAFFSEYQGNVILSSTGADTGREPVIYDDSEYRFIDVNPGKNGSSPFYYKEYEDKIYFIAKDSIHGRELYEYDGRQARMVADFNSGLGDGTPRPDFRESYEAVIYKDELYFLGNDGIHGHELVKYDGNSIQMVKDILPGEEGSEPKWLTVFQDKLFFTANDGTHGEELWVYDGKVTEMMKDIHEGPNGSFPHFLQVYEDNLFYTAEDGMHGRELWIVKRVE